MEEEGLWQVDQQAGQDREVGPLLGITALPFQTGSARALVMN